jgi:hypothetical protein
MPALRDRLDVTPDAAVDALADHIRQRLDERWQPLAEERTDELQRYFEEHGDPAYALYSQLLLEPVREELAGLEAAGYSLAPPFPGRFPDSVEPRTPAEHRIRNFWTVVSTADGHPLGTIVYRLHHDHTRFRIPQAPEVLPLQQTDRDEIRGALKQL